ncbi:MAG: hypothetical protein U9N73_08490, partial [Candidatus Auribacterota bacterium]|nr:hypothetical protein [Candidatus Auribacterota bacterium]
MSIESEIFTLFNEEKRKIEKGIERTLKGTVVDLAGNTPFDTGYHAMNWQLKNHETESTIGVYSKKNKRGFQQVLDMVSNRADKFEFSFDDNPNASIFNNGKKIDDLEAG